MKEGIRRGMIRSVDDCKAGIDAVKHTYLKISLLGKKGEQIFIRLMHLFMLNVDS
jgi:hypothetical protein